MYIWCENSAKRIMTNSRIPKDATTDLKLDSAKNMTVYGQICLRNVKDFTVSGVEFSNLPNGVTAKFNFCENAIFNDGVPYPDNLSNLKSVSVKAHVTQIVWVTLCVSKTADIGDYDIGVKVFTTDGEFDTNLSLKVYSTVLPKVENQTFNHEYFFSPYNYFGEYKNELVPDDFYKFDCYSDEWWALLRKQLDALKDLRVNTFYLTGIIYLIASGSKRISESEWHLNFEIIDKLIDCVLEYPNFSRIAVAASLSSVSGETVEFIDYDGKCVNKPRLEKDSELWIITYFTALYDYFKKKGILSMVYMHLEDEPHGSEPWIWARKICRECMPGVLCGEPIDTGSVCPELKGECDIYIPRLEVFTEQKKHLKARQKKGDEVWCYSCCFPEEPWLLNKFIDLPHSYSRLIEWACFSQGITGFLHWGFSHWYTHQLYAIKPYARFKGDGYIVYPDFENSTVTLSARAVATIEGVEEYELLSMLYKKDPLAAKKISKKVASSFDKFSPDKLNQARREILELLEKN